MMKHIWEPNTFVRFITPVHRESAESVKEAELHLHWYICISGPIFILLSVWGQKLWDFGNICLVRSWKYSICLKNKYRTTRARPWPAFSSFSFFFKYLVFLSLEIQPRVRLLLCFQGNTVVYGLLRCLLGNSPIWLFSWGFRFPKI